MIDDFFLDIFVDGDGFVKTGTTFVATGSFFRFYTFGEHIIIVVFNGETGITKVLANGGSFFLVFREKVADDTVDAFGFDFGRFVHFAFFGNTANETLADDNVQSGGEEEGFNTHIQKTRKDTGSGVGVESGKHEVAGESGLHSEAGSFGVTNLPDHDNVRVLAEN